jgi:hypothetical protein
MFLELELIRPLNENRLNPKTKHKRKKIINNGH